MKYKICSENKLPVSFDAWKIFESTGLELIQFNLKPGEIISSHKNDFDVFFFVFNGSIQFNIENESFNVSKEEVLFVQKNLNRSCKNISNEDVAKVLVIKTKN